MLQKIESIIAKITRRLKPRIIQSSYVSKLASVGPGTQFVNSSIEKHSYCGSDCQILDVKIGSFCSIANDCIIGTDSHSINWVSTSPVFNRNRDQIRHKYSLHEFQTRRITQIGNDVWIGAKAIVMSGVSIGNGSIIGAGSIVTKNIPPYEIWAGVPAKRIRARFADETATALNKSEWWSLSDTRLESLAKHIMIPELFIKDFHETK